MNPGQFTKATMNKEPRTNHEEKNPPKGLVIDSITTLENAAVRQGNWRGILLGPKAQYDNVIDDFRRYNILHSFLTF